MWTEISPSETGLMRNSFVSRERTSCSFENHDNAQWHVCGVVAHKVKQRLV